jgi:hypothetical protein
MSITVKSTAWPYKVKEPLDPQAVMNYGIDWTDWLPEDASIASTEWTLTNATRVHQAVDEGVSYVWLTPTVTSGTVTATCHVVLDTAPVSLEDDRTLLLTVKDR